MRDPRLGYKAEGLLRKVLGFDPNWVFRRIHLMRLSTNGESSFNQSIQELKRFGYDAYDNTLTTGAPDQTLGPDTEATYQLLDDHRFIRIRNAALRDPNTSDKAKALLLTMLSFPRGHAFSPEHLTRFATDKIVSVRAGLRVLKLQGRLPPPRAQRPSGAD